MMLVKHATIHHMQMIALNVPTDIIQVVIGIMILHTLVHHAHLDA